MFDITLPSCAAHPEPNNAFKTASPLVIVGANGSGKSRLAIWLEQRNPAHVHRVSAQRLLSFPDDMRGTDIGKAEAALLYGHESFNPTHANSKFGHRYGGGHDGTLADFQKLITLLFSEASQANAEYYARMKDAKAYEAPPVRKLDRIKMIWEAILPKRELIIGGHKIEVRQRGSAETYSAHEMSDGERVIFYLIGQCLCARKAGVIVIDEPELHLHRALQGRLWDAVEAARSDCLFVYVTHDLDFAATRAGGTAVWVNEFGGGMKWQWDFVPAGTPFPQALLLEILGSRRPILFVEGKRGGLDEKIYTFLYPEFHVMSVGGCENVIHLTASARNLKGLGQLHIDTCGLIDHDGRDVAAVRSLVAAGVSVLGLSEIENILLQEAVVRNLCIWQHRDGDAVFAALKTKLLDTFKHDSDRVATEIAGRNLDRKMQGWDWKHPTGGALKASLAAYLSTLDPDAELRQAAADVGSVIAAQDYAAALRIYPNKGLTALAGRTVGVTDYVDCVIRRLSAEGGEALVKILKSLVPTIVP